MVVEIAESEFDYMVNLHQYAVVEFGAEWCGPCKKQLPVLQRLSEKREDYLVAKVDIDKAPKLKERFGIQSVPTTISFMDGVVLGTATGAQPYAKLVEQLNI